MSAYIVPKPTIDAIVTFAGGCLRSWPAPPLSNEAYLPFEEIGADHIGKLLWEANVANVNHLYGERNVAAVYAFTPVTHFKTDDGKPPRQLTGVDIIRFCDNIEYQSQDQPGWDASWAAQFLQAVRKSAAWTLPGYGDGPWDLREGEIDAGFQAVR